MHIPKKRILSTKDTKMIKSYRAVESYRYCVSFRVFRGRLVFLLSPY